MGYTGKRTAWERAGMTHLIFLEINCGMGKDAEELVTSSVVKCRHVRSAMEYVDLLLLDGSSLIC